MKNSVQPLEVGVLSHFSEDGSNPFERIARHGVGVTQFCNWEIPMWTSKNAALLTRQARDCKVRINSLWCGYSGPQVWNFIEGPSTLGLVPPEYRKMRIAELKKGADFAVECSLPAIVTHCGFIPENPTDPLYQGTIDAIGEVASYCHKLGIGFWFETGQETPVTLLRAIQDIGLPNVDGRNLGREVRVGKGRSRYPVLIPKLYKKGYNGALIIEREISGERQTRDIIRTVTYLRALADRTIAKGR